MSKIPSQQIFNTTTHSHSNMQGVESSLPGKRTFCNQDLSKFSSRFSQLDFCYTSNHLQTLSGHFRISSYCL